MSSNGNVLMVSSNAVQRRFLLVEADQLLSRESFNSFFLKISRMVSKIHDVCK